MKHKKNIRGVLLQHAYGEGWGDSGHGEGYGDGWGVGWGDDCGDGKSRPPTRWGVGHARRKEHERKTNKARKLGIYAA